MNNKTGINFHKLRFLPQSMGMTFQVEDTDFSKSASSPTSFRGTKPDLFFHPSRSRASFQERLDHIVNQCANANTVTEELLDDMREVYYDEQAGPFTLPLNKKSKLFVDKDETFSSFTGPTGLTPSRSNVPLTRNSNLRNISIRSVSENTLYGDLRQSMMNAHMKSVKEKSKILESQHKKLLERFTIERNDYKFNLLNKTRSEDIMRRDQNRWKGNATKKEREAEKAKNIKVDHVWDDSRLPKIRVNPIAIKRGELTASVKEKVNVKEANGYQLVEKIFNLHKADDDQEYMLLEQDSIKRSAYILPLEEDAKKMRVPYLLEMRQKPNEHQLKSRRVILKKVWH